ncbi:short-chain fatty acid transporter [Robiginitalea sp. SC105]|uniref:short-chain fatty acid transporter n=1 Tax=Robiginitalea sp. SC105 TaxID=2762332 RepID=UPI001639CBDE|nr:TIGR00366 family protein [Robiginitalea sp. SC105]MBC2837935.1 short-chain fatty acid transporter [Robiginitalea sp. SC105]
MSVTRTIESLFRRFLPSPFAIAVLLSLLTFLLGGFFGAFPDGRNPWSGTLRAWESGLWNRDLLVFAYQMMLILVLGHVLVLSKPAEKLIGILTARAGSAAGAALLVASTTMLVSFFNWGLGLIFGAILARKVGEHALKNKIPINYPLIGACGYLGLMVWHGGISGSAPIKASEAGHLDSLLRGVLPETSLAALPGSIPTSETVFGFWNLCIFLAVLFTVSGLAYWLGRSTRTRAVELPEYRFDTAPGPDGPGHGAERMDRSPWLSTLFALLIFTAFLLQYLPDLRELNLSPDMLNFFMLGLALLLHGNFRNFLHAVESAIGDTAGILIQFPLYFGIMGIMTEAGLIHRISDFFIAISSEWSFPLFTFFSAGLVNLFVPSGGGQWAVQGPIILEAALQLGVPLPKALMSLAYGDQLTNMLQPFWALPLLGITRLKAREILPYSLLFMCLAGVVYLLGLMLW